MKPDSNHFHHLHLLLIAAILLCSCSSLQSVALPKDSAEQGTEISATVADYWPTNAWRTSSPAEQGMNAQMLADMLEKVRKDRIALHSLLVIRHGAIVSETYFGNYTQNTRHVIWSCTKSVMSTLIGMAIDRGLIQGVDQKILDFFPLEIFANMDEQKAAMTLENLLTMTTGLDWNENNMNLYAKPDWTQYVLGLPIIHQPGETFNYCTGCSHILSVILEQSTGMDAEAFARANLFTPLGITNYTWERNPEGSPIGGWGLELTPRDMAKLGYLYLHNGAWEGQQIVSPKWVNNATQKHVTSPSDAGYGYQWWVYPKAYAALGMKGQTIYVLPDLDLIVVTTADLPNHDPIFQLIDQYILPAIN